MNTVGDIEVRADLIIPAAELEWRFSRSGGPGGQHVNTSDTRVELRWSVGESAVLSDSRRALLLSRLGSRLDADSALRVVAADQRSQHQNRVAAAERLADIVTEALKPVKRRRKTKPTRASRERRLRTKRRHSEKKRDRDPAKDWP